MLRKSAIYFWLAFFVSLNQLNAQDQIFLKNNDGILDCYIININDSTIIFRTLDANDKNEYEIPNDDTYGFILEDPKKLQETFVQFANQLHFYHPDKKRIPVLKPGKAVVYRLKSDTIFFPRRGKMVSLTADTMTVELKKRKQVERINIGLDEVIMFGYTTFFTEILTLIAVPSKSVSEDKLQIFRKLSLLKGWTWKVMPPGEDELMKKKYRRKFRRGQLLKLPKSVKKKQLREQNDN